MSIYINVWHFCQLCGFNNNKEMSTTACNVQIKNAPQAVNITSQRCVNLNPRAGLTLCCIMFV